MSYGSVGNTVTNMSNYISSVLGYSIQGRVFEDRDEDREHTGNEIVLFMHIDAC